MIEELCELLLNNKSFISIIEMPLTIYNAVLGEIRRHSENRNYYLPVKYSPIFTMMRENEHNRFVIWGNEQKVISSVSFSCIEDCISFLKRLDNLKVML